MFNGTNSEWIDLGDWSDVSCIVDPDSCITGFTLAMWVNTVSTGSYNGILGSRSYGNNTGMGVFCFHHKI